MPAMRSRQVFTGPQPHEHGRQFICIEWEEKRGHAQKVQKVPGL
jgi:hypothetical protein